MLSRGGAKFDKRRFKNDIQLFAVSSSQNFLVMNYLTARQGKQNGSLEQGESINADGELPASLDFFKYAQSGLTNNKRKVSETSHHGPGAKKRRVSLDSENERNDEDEGQSSTTELKRPTRHRVAAKGSNVPDQIDSFETLQERYGVPSRILCNLSDNGYIHPTSIQSYGIPILMEVRLSAPYGPSVLTLIP